MAERRSNLIDMRFVVVPAVIGLAGFKLQKLMQPIYGGLFGLDYDPAYAYLLNGLSLLQGYVPGHVDHPGTPLQALSAAVIFLAQLFGRISGAAQNDIELVLNSPEYCLQLISSVLLLLNGIAIFFLGRCIHATSGSTLLAIIAQCSYFLLHGLFPRLLYVSPEALVLFSGTMAAACLSGYILGQSSASTQQVNGIGKAVAVGFFLALGVTSKVTFFPLLLLVLLLPNTRLRILGGVSFIVSVAVCLAPIVPAIGRMINWFSAIATHSGHYGEGPREFVRIEAVLPNILSLLTNAPLLTAAVVVCVGVMTADAIRHRKGCESRHSIFVGGIFLAVLLGEILLVSKHYYLHYALPAISICPIVLIWAGNRMHQMIGDSRLLPPILASVLGFVVLVSFGQMLGLIQGASARAIVRDDELSKLDSELKRHPGALVVGHYRVRSKGYPIQFFREAARVLRPGGRIVMVEPAITAGSQFFYRYLHRELVDMSDDPLRDGLPDPARDPYASNQAIPTLLATKYRDQFHDMLPELRISNVEWFSFAAYPLSGGFQKWGLISSKIAAHLIGFERKIERRLGRLMGFRLLMSVTRR